MLFDADGVVQASREGWIEELTAWGGSRAEEFLLAIAAADVSCLTGNDFGAAMRRSAPAVRDRLRRSRTSSISISGSRSGSRCSTRCAPFVILDCTVDWRPISRTCAARTCAARLASRRSSTSSSTPIELGFAKPEAGYFQAIMDRINVAPNRVLFIDDHEGNVAGAREIGIHSELFPRDGGVAGR